MKDNLVTVIMAGGSGTRFWPLSRESKAKQSLALFSEKSLLCETIERVKDISKHILVVSSKKQEIPVRNDIEKYSDITLLLEPSARNTAPCIMLASHWIKLNFNENMNVLVLPSDHHVANVDAFRNAVSEAVAVLSSNPESIGTIGIEPNRPETGYGYLQKGNSFCGKSLVVRKFEEKPNAERAEMFFKSGEYLWNGGIFLFNTATMNNEFKNIKPAVFEGVQKINSFNPISKEIYDSIESISFDYAIMENTRKTVFTVPADFGWNDVGSWLSYYELLKKDEKGNASKGDVFFVKSSDCLAYNETSRPLVIYGKKGELVIELEDVSLTADIANHQQIKEIVALLAAKGRNELI